MVLVALKITPIEQKLYDLLSEPVAGFGYDLVRIKFNNASKAPTLQIMIDHQQENQAVNRGINLEDCEAVSRFVSNILDVEDPIESNYNLEVSSPGLDRPLVFIKDFDRFKGSKVLVKTQELVGDSRKLRGYIVGVNADETVDIRMEQQLQPTKKQSGKKKRDGITKEEPLSPEIVSIHYRDIVAAHIVSEY